MGSAFVPCRTDWDSRHLHCTALNIASLPFTQVSHHREHHLWQCKSASKPIGIFKPKCTTYIHDKILHFSNSRPFLPISWLALWDLKNFRCNSHPDAGPRIRFCKIAFHSGNGRDAGKNYRLNLQSPISQVDFLPNREGRVDMWRLDSGSNCDSNCFVSYCQFINASRWSCLMHSAGKADKKLKPIDFVSVILIFLCRSPVTNLARALVTEIVVIYSSLHNQRTIATCP